MSVAMMADAADDDATRVEPKPCGSTRSWNQEMGTSMRKKMEIPNFRKIVDNSMANQQPVRSMHGTMEGCLSTLKAFFVGCNEACHQHEL